MSEFNYGIIQDLMADNDIQEINIMELGGIWITKNRAVSKTNKILNVLEFNELLDSLIKFSNIQVHKGKSFHTNLFDGNELHVIVSLETIISIKKPIKIN